MPPKKLRTHELTSEILPDLFTPNKSKPKDLADPNRFADYIAERNKVIAATTPHKSTLQEIAEYGLIGVKSARNPKIVQADTPRKHEEITLQATFSKWVVSEYPEIKFLHHEREGQRSFVKGNINQVINNAGAMPDMEFILSVGNYTGLYIEFKRPGEDWLLKDKVTVKSKYAHQYANHCMLWRQNKVVYFCNDLKIAKMILQQYLEGRTMRKRVYQFPKGLEHLNEI